MRWWNIARMMAELEDGDDSTRLDTVTNLVEHPPNLDDALGLIRRALGDPPERVVEMADQALCRLSGSLGVENLGRHAARLREDPSDVATLTLMLWVHFRDFSQSEESREARQRLVLWVIEAMPRAPVAGTPLDSVWDSRALRDGEEALDVARRGPYS